MVYQVFTNAFKCFNYRYCKPWANHIILDVSVAAFVMSVLMGYPLQLTLITRSTVLMTTIVCLLLNVPAVVKVSVTLQ